MPYHITPDGVPLYYLDGGHGAPVILIYGWTMNHKFFDATFRCWLAITEW